ncbi:primosomal protein N' [Synechococcales cyanobacterium C]|uniref:Replication restart protein PriA n=1 Tax=Petrachloros mirabilis ULC683 TaxID=2781853 RepID=A0A8K2A0J7_9CYAN|nr:primosomal protein N' [Petrachloros mirabilis]NCJ08760.1 primosomal protein N' [Petrachloros mirabilis ULC683]
MSRTDEGKLEVTALAQEGQEQPLGSSGSSLKPVPALPAYVEVLVDCPGVEDLFTYQIPAELMISPGDILSVQFGAQQVGAIAVRLTAHCPLPPTQIRAVLDVISTRLFPPHYWPLLERVAQYYHTPLITAIRAALPPGLLTRSQRRIRLCHPNPDPDADLSPAARTLVDLLQRSPSQDYTWAYLQRQVKGASRGLRELQQRGWVESVLQPQQAAQPKRQQVVTLLTTESDPLSPRQREILTVLQQRGGELWLQELLQTCKTTSTTVKTLARKGCVSISPQERLRLESSPIHSDQALTLTPDQATALATLSNLRGYAQVLLHGVTGSGKTEVYLQAIAPILAQGQSALVLVPEIGLTPQLTDRFRARFGDRVRVYHSALSDGERYDTWRYLLGGTPQVVIGTRSAVFAPLSNVGLIILDEEHDTGYKQDQPAPSYHARTVAQWRAELENCPLVLGSATPALDSWVQCHATETAATQHYISLPQRVQNRPMPPITIVDMRLELQMGNRSMFSRQLQAALMGLRERQQQGLLFMHRRGHSTFVSCRSCGYVMECPHCSVSLTYHHSDETQQPLLRCHYCNYTQLQSPQCPQCQSPYFRFFGSGTQRVMAELKRQFPDLRLLRFDSDTTRVKGAHRQLLNQFAQGQADLMVGTQMLTKGLDLPQVQVVGVLAADGLLNLSDYRASERTFQTLLQVAGRSGRGEQPGTVILQTYNPDHPVIQAVQRYDYEGFVQAELEQRQTLHYPPYGQLIALRVSGLDLAAVEATAQTLATVLQHFLDQQEPETQILGPAPATILRVARRYRWQILVKRPVTAIQKTPLLALPIADLQQQCANTVRLSIDVDPLNLL